MCVNARDRRSPWLILSNSAAEQSESELVVDDAQPDLCDVHCHLLADERMLGAGVDVAERALESATLADRGGPGRQMSPLGGRPCCVGGVPRGDPHVGAQLGRPA